MEFAKIVQNQPPVADAGPNITIFSEEISTTISGDVRTMTESYEKFIAGSRMMLIVFFLITLYACNSAKADSTPVLAKIGKDAITAEQFSALIMELPKDKRSQLLMNEEAKEKFLDEIINARLAYKKALRERFDKKPDVAEKIKEAIEKVVVLQYLEEEVNPKIKISDKEVKDFYTDNIDKLIISEQIRIKLILLSTQAEADQVLEKIKQGEDFESLAREKSIDPSGRRGGDLGWMEKRVIDPVIAEVAYDLDLGEVSEVVRAQYGYHILKVEDRKSPEYAELTGEISDGIRKELVLRQRKEKTLELFESLRKDEDISIDEHILKTIQINIEDD